MIACSKKFAPEGIKGTDDYTQTLEEWAELVETKWRDSLISAGVREAEDADFRRRKWHRSFVARLREFMGGQADTSPAALSLEAALNEAQVRKDGSVFVVWIGPLARQWLRSRRNMLKAFFGDSYERHVRYM